MNDETIQFIKTQLNDNIKGLTKKCVATCDSVDSTTFCLEINNTCVGVLIPESFVKKFVDQNGQIKFNEIEKYLLDDGVCTKINNHGSEMAVTEHDVTIWPQYSLCKNLLDTQG